MKRTKRKKISRPLLLILALLLLLGACRAPADESEPVSENAESEPVPESEPPSAPESEPEAEPESEPMTAKERMKKLVREEAGPLADELAAEKEADPVFDMDTSPDPEKVARLEEVRKRLAELEEVRDEYGRYPEEFREEAEALALEQEGLELSIPRMAGLRSTLSYGYSYYAYFGQVIYSLLGEDIPGGIKSPYLDGRDYERTNLFSSGIEILGNRGSYPESLLDLVSADEDFAIFTADVIGGDGKDLNGTLFMKVTEVFWGETEIGETVGYRYPECDLSRLPDCASFLIFARVFESAEYEEREIPLFRGYTYGAFLIGEDGTLLPSSTLKDAGRLDGLEPEEGVKLVLRNYLKYFRAGANNRALKAD